MLLGDAEVLAIAEHCPLLRELDGRNGMNVTNATLTKLVDKCPQLRSLGTLVGARLTDKGVLAIAQHCAVLVELDMANCKYVTMHSLRSVIKQCPELARLCVPNTLCGERFPLNAQHRKIKLHFNCTEEHQHPCMGVSYNHDEEAEAMWESGSEDGTGGSGGGEDDGSVRSGDGSTL
jgi:uncharacterized membrane protein YgcG